MDEDELVHGIVNSLAFEVEAVPDDNVIKFASTNGTPLNVKVRVRNKDEPRLVQRGIISVPKLGKHVASLDQIKLISSDQTILSFTVFMETELKKHSPPKSRKHGLKFFRLGGCLGTPYDEDEGPYLPGTSIQKALRSSTSSKSGSDVHNENIDVAEKLKLNLETQDQKKLFGKCKPGGCLDPPFGEDKEPYRAVNLQAHMKPKQTAKVLDSKEGQSISTSSIEPGKSSKEPAQLLRKEVNKNVIEPKPLLDIYSRPVSLEPSSTSNYSNANRRHPSKMTSSKMLDAGIKTNTTYDDDSIRQSYQYPETYFIPPKSILQHKEEERRYSRERSNDQIRPATTRRENDHQASATPHIFDVPNKIYPDNADARSPTKLPKHKGKDNTERIKQTLTDLTSIEIYNAQKASEDSRKNSKAPVYVPVVTQNDDISPNYKETSSHDIRYPKKNDNLEIPIVPDDLDPNIISQSHPKGAKNRELHQNMPAAKSKEAIDISLEEKPKSKKSYESENENRYKDMRKKEIFNNEEPINATKLEPGKIEDLYISPTLVSVQDDVKILRSVPSSDTQKSRQVEYLPSYLKSLLEDKLTKTSDRNKNSTDSRFPQYKPKDQTKLSIAEPSLENGVGVDDKNSKNNITSEACLKDTLGDENRVTNIYLDTAKFVDTVQNAPKPEKPQEQTNESKKVEIGKQIDEESNLLLSRPNDEDTKKSLRTGEILRKPIKEIKNDQDDQIRDSQTSIKLEPDKIQKPFNDFKIIENSARITLQDLDLEIINNNKNNDLVGVGTRNKIPDEKFGNLHSKGTSNYDITKNNTNLMTDQQILQNTAPSEVLHKQVLDEKYQKTKRNDVNDIVLNSTTESGVVVEISNQDPINGNTQISNSPDVKDGSLDNGRNLNTVKARKPSDIAKVTSNDLEKNGKQSQDGKYTKSDLSDSLAPKFDQSFDSDSKKQQSAATVVHNRHSEQHPIELNTKNLKSDSARNSLHDNILSADKEFATSFTIGIDSLNKLNDHIFNYEENKIAPENVNVTENDHVIIKNTSLYDRNKNLSINTQHKMPSTILQRTPLERTADDSDLFNDDINVIKPFKRNTFTIVASSTSLEKQEEPISTQQTNNVADEYLKNKKNEKLFHSQSTTDVEHYPQNEQQQNNRFVVDLTQETISIHSFSNISSHSKTSLVILDRPRGSYSERENKSNVPESENQQVPANQKTNYTEVTLNTKYDDRVKTKDDEKSSLASNIVTNDVNIIDTEIHKCEEDNYNNEKLILKNISVDLPKLISELQDRSDDDIGLKPMVDGTQQRNEKIVYDILSDKIDNPTSDNKAIRTTQSQWQDNTDGLSNIKISISNVPVSSEGVESILTEGHTKDTEYVSYGETIATISDDKSDTNYARNAMEYGSRLLEISERKLNLELKEPIKTSVDISESTVASKPDAQTFKRFSFEIPGSELDTRPIHTKNQRASMVGLSGLGIVGSFNKIINKESLAPEDATRYFSKHENDDIVEEDDKIRKISGPSALESFKKIIDKHSLVPKNDTIYYSEHDGGTKIDKYGDLRKLSGSGSVGSLNKDIDTKPTVPKDGIRYYTKYDSSPKIDENGDLRKTSKPDLVGIFNEVPDKKPLLANDGITRDIDQNNVTKTFEDCALRKLSDFDAVGSLRKDIDKSPLVHEDGTRYYSEYAASSKASISTDRLGNIDQSATKTHLNTSTGKKLREQIDSVILKQQDITKIKAYDQNGNKPNKAEHEGIISRPIQKNKSEILLLNLALQTYMNDSNETVVQTLNPLVEPIRYTDDNITVVQSLIRHGQEIRIPVDVHNDLSLKFMNKNQKIPQNVSIDQHGSKKARITKNLSEHAQRHPEDVDKSLAFIYERELIPLHSIIKNLTEEINTLTTQQEQLKHKLRGAKRTKSLRVIPVSKRCGCGRM